MPLITLTFDRVFDIHRHHGSRYWPQHTEFSFEAGGRELRSVRVDGWPELRAGQTITAQLRSEGDWQTLEGWVDHDTGIVSMRSQGRTITRLLGALMFGGWCVAFALNGGLEVASGLTWTWVGVFVVCIGTAIEACHALWRARSDRARLRAAAVHAPD